MLMLKPNCECCDTDLSPTASEARICTYECTFCADCAATHFNNICPNCGGNFVPRPVRTAAQLRKHPAATQRFTKPHAACLAAQSS